MKKIITLIGLALIPYLYLGAISTSVNVTTPGALSTLLSASQKSTLTDLTVTGNIDARDIKCMRDEMPLLAMLDLSNANIFSYTGTDGTSYFSTKSVAYPANEMPANSFLINATNTGKTTLKTLKFPNSLVTIGVQAFYSCTGLAGTLIVPASVISIGSLAFYNCSGLAKIQIGNVTPPTIQYSTFMNVNKSTCVLAVPLGAVAKYRAANYWKDFASIVEPFSVLVNCSQGGEVVVNSSVIKDNALIPVNQGSSLTFSFNPNANYRLASLTFDGVNVLTKVINNQYTTPAASKNGILHATFAIKQYNLLIRSSEGGTTNLICDYGTTPTFDLTPNNGQRIMSVFYNDLDVTASLVNGVYTVPPIISNSTLKIVYSNTLTAIETGIGSDVKIYGRQSEIMIEGCAAGEVVKVFTVLGKEVTEIRSVGERIVIPVAKGAVYVVKTARKTQKVML
ncbi:MAG: leucine-rich repeat protein [Paludibacter sp.]